MSLIEKMIKEMKWLAKYYYTYFRIKEYIIDFVKNFSKIKTK